MGSRLKMLHHSLSCYPSGLLTTLLILGKRHCCYISRTVRVCLPAKIPAYPLHTYTYTNCRMLSKLKSICSLNFSAVALHFHQEISHFNDMSKTETLFFLNNWFKFIFTLFLNQQRLGTHQKIQQEPILF